MLAREMVLMTLLATAKLSYGDETPPQLGDGRYAPSPDGKLYVIYEVPQIEVHDAKTSQVVASTEWEMPVHAFLWTGDSKTLIIVHHIAHGSDASFFHTDGHAWRVQGVDQLWEHSDYRGIAVVDVRAAHDTVGLMFKTYIPTQLVSLTFVPSSGKFRNVRHQNISFERWEQLRMFPLDSTSASNHAMERTPKAFGVADLESR